MGNVISDYSQVTPASYSKIYSIESTWFKVYLQCACNHIIIVIGARNVNSSAVN